MHSAGACGQQALRAWFAVILAWQAVGVLQAQVRPVVQGEIVLDHEVVVEGYSSSLPVYATHAGDGSGRLFVVERPGTIRVLQNDRLLSQRFLDISSEVVSSGERGLLGLAFHPGFADQESDGFRKLYTFHSTQQMQPPDFPIVSPQYQHVVTEWQVDLQQANRVDLTTRREVMRFDHRNQIHPGSILVFDNEARLYVSLGDPTAGHGQDTSNAPGSILRIDPLDPSLTPESPDPISANGKYRIPATNPFLNDPDAIDEIFAYGFRNPWRGSVDRETGLLFVGDVGQGAREEIDVVVAGGNYGWSVYEGTRLHQGVPHDPASFVPPLAEYDHSHGRAVVGGFVYRGSAIPWLQGQYVFGDLTSSPSGGFDAPGAVFYFDPYDEAGNLRDSSGVQIAEFSFLGGKNSQTVITSLAEDEAGELYVLGVSGTNAVVRRLIAGPAPLEGDFNGNASVEQADLDLVLLNWGANGMSPPAGWINDLPAGIIDQEELDAALLAWGDTYPGAASAPAVPEPQSAVLMLLASGVMMATAALVGRSARR